MSVLRRTRTEVAGAWRSLRYDLGRDPVQPPADGPDVTSTGMGTWGLDGLVEQAGPEPAPPARRPRRAVAMTAFGTLTVVGAAGAYLAVVNGLGSLTAEKPAAADTFPPRAAVTAGVGTGPSSRPVTTTRTRATVVTPRRTVAVVPPPAPPSPADRALPVAAPPPAAPAAKGPTRTVKPANPECHCQPPVPTPTAPSSPSPTPSPTPSASVPPSSSPSPSESADGSAVPSPSRSWDGRRHRRNH
ncbi:hypothetical protein [Paractinoplanes hotanensis]|uniref:Uncharacterized protein n=1 Tax=Paractinoplanes hotanensis TaxID=2906497 RepID=A0ABT0Y6U3_9ACTN|nr:hypothetical protein [Actinoplanes hotanensis]MCM4081555.1 hypothetical protein [Actinoplanes hotanensis]